MAEHSRLRLQLSLVGSWLAITFLLRLAVTVSCTDLAWTATALVWGAVAVFILATDRTVAGGSRPITALGISAAMGIASVVGAGTSFEPRAAAVLPALVCALFESLYFFWWFRLRLERFMTVPAAVMISAGAYAAYHLAYLGAHDFVIAAGMYLTTGMVMGAIVAYTRSILGLWPLFAAPAVAIDFSRLSLPLPATAGSVAAAAWLAPALAMVVLRLAQNRDSVHDDDRVGGPGIPPVSRRWRVAGVWLMAVLIIGLQVRLIINDPLVIDAAAKVVDAARFALPRDPLRELLLRAGYAVYLGIPLVAIYLGHDSRGSRVRTVGAAIATGAFGGLAVIVTAGVAGLLHGPGHLVTGLNTVAVAVMTGAAVLYGLLNSLLVSAVSHGVGCPGRRWFILLLGFIFIFNWWMVYPLFSQYGAAGPLPEPGDVEAYGLWLSAVWERATPLYAMVPHYHYYMSLVATYARFPLDRDLVSSHLAMLAGYTMAAWCLAASSLRALTRDRALGGADERHCGGS